uniref:Uncharacterized protein n=1 Tax=Psilocybe cubensis TaxID=181762 RepID=A0A8H7XPC9_PSICU
MSERAEWHHSPWRCDVRLRTNGTLPPRTHRRVKKSREMVETLKELYTSDTLLIPQRAYHDVVRLEFRSLEEEKHVPRLSDHLRVSALLSEINAAPSKETRVVHKPLAELHTAPLLHPTAQKQDGNKGFRSHVAICPEIKARQKTLSSKSSSRVQWARSHPAMVYRGSRSMRRVKTAKAAKCPR